jgi:hypothetical protein
MDIVERLLMPIQWCAVTSVTPTTTFSIAAQEDYNAERREAADEIRRLRANQLGTQAGAGACKSPEELDQVVENVNRSVIRRLEAEIERLRDWGSMEARKAFEAEAEIKRLLADNAQWQDRCLRYQTALESIEDCDACSSYFRARLTLSNNLDTKPDSA